MPADRSRAGLTISEAARRQGVSTRSIEKGLASGRYARLRDGSFDPASLVGIPERGPASQGADLVRIRAAHETLKAKMTRIELEKLERTVIAVAEAERIFFMTFRTLWDQLLNLPVRVAAPLEMKPAAEIRVFLDRELRDMLTEVADGTDILKPHAR